MWWLILFLAIVFTLQWNAAGLAEENWYEEHEKGWFWYELIPEIQKEEPKEPPKPEAPMQVSTPSVQEPQAPPPLSADWIRENLEKYEKIAIDNPTPDNVRAFLYLQRVMLDKSQRFSDQVKHVVQMDALLDQGTRRPSAEYGGAQYSKEVLATRRRLMAEIAKKAGIFFFFQGGCGQCEIQAPVLKRMKDRDDFVIFPISVNGMPLKSNMFPDYAIDKGQARSLKVFQTPAMFLGKPDTREILPLAQNTLSRDQLEDRILVAARDAGWISQDEFNSTRALKAELALDLNPYSMPKDLKEEELIDFVKNLYRQRADGMSEISGSINDDNCKECKSLK